MSFSDHRGGTLALPSPTHAHQIDVTSAVRTLRRSLSRSPSKLSSRAASPSCDSPRSLSPHSPYPKLSTTPKNRHIWPVQPQTAPPAPASAPCPTVKAGSPFASLRNDLKLSLRSAKTSKASTPSRSGRLRASPKSPLRKALGVAPGLGNLSAPQTPTTLKKSISQGSSRSSSTSPSSHTLTHQSSRHSLHLDVTGVSQAAFLKALDTYSDSMALSTSGTLKRSDATMSLDRSAHDSPVAKRRSLHGFSSLLPSDFSVNLESRVPSPLSFEIHEDANLIEEVNGGKVQESEALPASPSLLNLTKRTSSLRKSTLQQRHGDKGSLGRKSGERQLAQITAEPGVQSSVRPRLASDHFMPPPALGTGLTAAMPGLSGISNSGVDGRVHQPHPLSRTMTTSSNAVSSVDTFAKPTSTVNHRPAPHPFSRSLPLNATRPSGQVTTGQQDTVSTPNHKHQLWIGAFNSTGLISKVNRDIDDDNEQKMAPPDTPCKKHANPFATFPPPQYSINKQKSNNRNSFSGVPSTPLDATSATIPDTFGKPGKGLTIFQRGSAARTSHRGSILDRESEQAKAHAGGLEKARFTNGQTIPPTPTRPALTPSLSNVSEQSLESPSANRAMVLPVSTMRPPLERQSTCKFYSKKLTVPVDMSSQGDECLDVCAEAGDERARFLRLTSLSQARASKGLNTPCPLDVQLRSLPNSSRKLVTKIFRADSVSPLEKVTTPETPQETELPVGTRRMSLPFTPDALQEGSMHPPVTPTAARDLRSSTSFFVTPVNVRTANLDIDASLSSKFDNVEQIGRGEFSLVYRVTQRESQSPEEVSRFAMSDSNLSFNTVSGKVYAVKRSKHPYHGPKDRDLKRREVEILRALSHAEHVVHYIDDWEYNLHLYIQMEFCEEGTLDKFLANIGRVGRLDDFRIFKILQDLCVGLQEIHCAGFMHLDMKPANIFITFEGALKIGDFGLAQASDSANRVDTEGDREYMAPEMLEGRASQSADIFSLGLMTLEVAANVVLPDNGPTWIALRSGDLSEVPSLTWTPSIDTTHFQEGVDAGDIRSTNVAQPKDALLSSKRSELPQPPDFMVDAFHPSSLDSIVRWMTVQVAAERPTASQVLDLAALRWVSDRRRTPATVYEGNWGPADVEPATTFIVDYDTEMTDV